MKRRLLLHHCCGPCSPEVISRFGESYAIESFWFNPNIQPAEEKALREAALLALAVSSGLPVSFGPEYPESEWLEKARSAGADRCGFCYYLRLKETAKAARAGGLECFSTTLLSSPYQKHELIKETAFKIAEEEKVNFIYEDFRPHFYEGKQKAREMGLYLQKYCGCIFSKQERESQKKRKPVKGFDK